MLANFPHLHVEEIATGLRLSPDRTRRILSDMHIRGYVIQSDKSAFAWMSTGAFDPDEGGEWPEESGPVREQ